MAAPSTTYVDPATGVDDPGTAGTIGDPFASLQYAYDNTTFDTTNGHIFYVVSGTADNNGNAAYTFANRTAAAPMYIVGYGGLGHVQTGTVNIANAYSYVHWQDMEVTSTSSLGLRIGAYSSAMGCTVNGNLTVSGSQAKAYGNTVAGKISASGNYSEVRYNNVTHSAGVGITCSGNSSHSLFNIVVSESGATGGILLTNHNAEASNNSLYASATVATGIECNDASYTVTATNNLIEGYTTSLKTATNTNGASFFCNSSYGETTLEDFSADDWYFGADSANESLGSSPFADAAGGDFTPQDSGSISTAFGATSLWRGAVSPASGGGLKLNPLGTGALA